MTSNRNSPEYQALDRELSPGACGGRGTRSPSERGPVARASRRCSSRSGPGSRAASRSACPPAPTTVRAAGREADADKAAALEINQELRAFSDFRHKVLADEDTWIILDSEADLAGLPPALVSAYKAAAAERKVPASGPSSTRGRGSIRS